jgi:hypothetical protein
MASKKVKIVAKRDININIGSIKIPLEKDKEEEIELSDRELEIILIKLGEKKGISEEITIDGKTLKTLVDEKKPKTKEGGSNENKDKKNPKLKVKEKIN